MATCASAEQATCLRAELSPYPQFVRPGRLSPHDRRLRLLPMLLTHLSFREIDEEMLLAGPRRGHRDPAQFPQAQGSGMVTCV